MPARRTNTVSLLSVFFGIALLLSGCPDIVGPEGDGGQREPGEREEQPPEITGTVVESVGGSPVEGATVSLSGGPEELSEVTRETGADGKFGFEVRDVDDLEVGIYQIVVTHPDRAGSRIQDARLEEDGLDLEIVQPYDARPELDDTPPTLKTDDLTPLQTVSDDTVSLTIEVDQAVNAISGGAGWPGMAFWIGSDSTAGSTADATSFADPLTYAWDTTASLGETAITVVAYDVKNNRTQWTIPVTVGDRSGQAPASVVSTTDPGETGFVALTTGVSLGIFSQVGTRHSLLATSVDAGTLTAAEDSSIVVNIEVEAVDDARGARIYRSMSGSAGPYSPIAEVSGTGKSDNGAEVHTYTDTSALLSPDTSVHYKLAYYNEYGEGAKSGSFEVEILPQYRVYLVSPDDGSAGVGLTPELEWNVTTSTEDLTQVLAIVDADLDVVDEVHLLDGETSHVVDPDTLSPGRHYEWTVLSEVTRTTTGVTSRSIPTMSEFANNGFFEFATATGE